jgi:tetratricopeptide (TPR) repeat protein
VSNIDLVGLEQLVDQAMQTEDKKTRIDLYEQILHALPFNPKKVEEKTILIKCLIGLGQAQHGTHHGLDHFVQALKLLETITDADPTLTYLVYLGSGNSLITLGQPGRAVIFYEKAYDLAEKHELGRSKKSHVRLQIARAEHAKKTSD